MVSEPVEDELPEDELVVDELELLADRTCFVVIFMVVSYGLITVGKTVPFLSIACRGTEPV